MTNPFAPQQPQQGGGGGNPFAPQQPPPQQAPAGTAAPPQQAPPPQQSPPPPQPPAAPQIPETFGQPARGSTDAISGDEWRSWVGALVLFQAHEFRTSVPTKNGEADAVLADVHIIDVPDGPILKERALVFPPALVTATKEAAQKGGGWVLGRIGAYTTQAKRDTVELLEHTDADQRAAAEYLRWRAQQAMQQPATGQTGEEPPF